MNDITLQNPLSQMAKTALTLWPELKCQIEFGELECEAHGVTTWPDDGGIPIISVSSALSLEAAVDVMAHELAHVAAGHDVGHGAEWDAAFEALRTAWVGGMDRNDD